MKTEEEIKNKIKKFEVELAELKSKHEIYAELVVLVVIRTLEWVIKDAEK